jgi:hypothetical protein
MARQLPALQDEFFLGIAGAVRAAILGLVNPYRPINQDADLLYEFEMRQMEQEGQRLLHTLHGRN